MPRSDDFTQEVKEILAKRVANVCCNPNCRQTTSGPASDKSKAINIGVAAHITAASPAGARYDPKLSSEERKSAENGIWCCQNCAKLIDNDPNIYSEKLLLAWKGLAEETTRLSIDSRNRREVFGQNTGGECEVALSSSQYSLNSHCLQIRFYLRNVGTEPIENYSITIHLPESVAQYLRDRNSDEPAEAMSLAFSGPYIWVESASQPENSGWVRVHYREKAMAVHHPLLPAGPAKPAAELDFGFTSTPEEFVTELMMHPIQIEYWGGKGAKREALMYLKFENKKVFYQESDEPFSCPDEMVLTWMD